MKKLTNEIVRKSFLKEGYTIPQDWQYINAHTKIPYTCPNEHNHLIIWTNWYKGQRCPYCSGNAKLTSKQVRDIFLLEGYTIPVDWQYINSVTKIPYTCPNGHENQTVYSNWKQGKRCNYCNRPLSEEVRKEFLNEGYTITENWEYINNHTKIPYTCPNKHKHGIMWNNWISGGRCKWCSRAQANLKYYNYESNDKLQLYFIRIYDWIHGRETFKYGITKHDVLKRFKQSIDDWGFKVEVIRQSTDTAEQICMLEQSLLYEVKGNRTKWVPKSFSGSTECFDLPLDNSLDIWNKIVNQ